MPLISGRSRCTKPNPRVGVTAFGLASEIPLKYLEYGFINPS
jgi:hypothetical protein